MNEYFTAAVTAWMFKQDNAAKIAAFTAAVSAAKQQRLYLVSVLRTFIGSGAITAAGSECLSELVTEIFAKDWGMWHVFKAKRILRKTEPQ
jgi:hypothetical protein